MYYVCHKIKCMSEGNAFTNKPRREGKELRIKRVSPMMHNDIQNIAAHIGVSVTDLVKTQLLNIISTYPKHYLEPFEK